jgi:phosphosulfolactate synthase (CoM biosynthesis protein A)
MPDDRPFPFLPLNRRPGKPRSVGLTEIRGPYYTPLGPRYLEDLLDTLGNAVDWLKFGGGSMALYPRPALRTLIDLCHRHHVRVSTGGFIEYVLTQGPAAVDKYLAACKELGFDVVEVSAGFISLPADDFVRLTERVRRAGLTPKPEVGVQFGAGGASAAEDLEAEGTRDAGWAVRLIRRHLDAGADLVMVESEGITENVRAWRTDVVNKLVDEFGPERLMFEAADPAVFTWYVKTYGADVNLFVDHSQIVQLECLRTGIWGTKDVWGRVLTYKP